MTKKTPKKSSTRTTKSKAGATSKRKPPAKGKSTGAKKAAKGRFSWLTKLALQLSLIVVCLFIFWMIYLNAVVREGFEGRRFQIPARVYSEAQELYSGQTLRQQTLAELLDQLGYVQSSLINQPGRYRIQGSSIILYSRGFEFWDGAEKAQKLVVNFSSDTIQSITDMAGRSVLLTRLDPLYLGQIYPESLKTGYFINWMNCRKDWFWACYWLRMIASSSTGVFLFGGLPVPYGRTLLQVRPVRGAVR